MRRGRPSGSLRLPDALRIASLALLAAPNLIYLLGWLRPAAGVPLALVLVAGLTSHVAQDGGDEEVRAAPPARSPLAWLAGLLPVLGIALLSGAGGVGPQSVDWTKHNAVLLDLLRQPWPVAYETAAGPTALVYYSGFYLPAAAIGKLVAALAGGGGWEAANAALFATTVAGAALAWLWLVALSGASPLVCGVVFAAFSGMDALGSALLAGPTATLEVIAHGRHLEWWSHWLQYSSTANLLVWAPQHALAGWLAGALALDALHRKDALPGVLLAVGLAALWSAFVALGLAALALPLAIASRERRTARAWRRLQSVAGLALLATLGLYYAARFAPYSLPEPIAAGLQVRANGFLPAVLAAQGEWLPTVFARLALFCAVEFGLLGALLWQRLGATGGPWAPRPVLPAALVLLGLLTLVRYGWYNDLPMRSSIPALFVLTVAAAHVLGEGRLRGAFERAVVAVLLVGSVTAAHELRPQLTALRARRELVRLAPESEVRDLFGVHDRLVVREGRAYFVPQYLGGARAPFFRWLARPLVPRRIAPGGSAE